jgi:Family of unknown function (DUF6508)
MPTAIGDRAKREKRNPRVYSSLHIYYQLATPMTANIKMNKFERAWLERLAAFAPAFRNPQIAFGKWHPTTGEGTLESPLTMPWFEMSEVARQFINIANGFIEGLKPFDWTEWLRHGEGRKLFESSNAIATADGEQLAKLSLALVRQDRFVEGTLAKAYDDKILLAIAERADSLLTVANPGWKL